MMAKRNKVGFDPLMLAESEKMGSSTLIPVSSSLDPNIPLPETLYVFPLGRMMLFPGIVLSVDVGDSLSAKTIEKTYAGQKYVAAMTQRTVFTGKPSLDDMADCGVFAEIVRVLDMPNGSTVVLLHGKRRIVAESPVKKQSRYQVKYKFLEEIPVEPRDAEYEAMSVTIRDLAIRVIDMSPDISSEMIFIVKNIDDPNLIVNFVATHVPVKLSEKEKLIQIADQKLQASALLDILAHELQLLEFKYHIETKVKAGFDKQQRDYMLRQQMRIIQEELGADPLTQEVAYLEETAAGKKWNAENRRIFERELKKLQRLNPASIEYSNQLNYLYIFLDIPWNEYTKDSFDLKRAQEVLDNEHFGLEKVKERLLEYLAVLKLKNDLKSPILCLVGPPGTGKTSLGKSIARALNRNYVRMSLGGLHDEAEIRGHRKTYIGAMPGRVIQSIRKAKSANPVFVLDEIDKLCAGAQGDPASALLEVLDPEQNSSFYDNYLEMEFDLSRVMFVATANNLSSVSPALRDRMEVIEVNGYVLEEKMAIARHHLIPKQVEAHGVGRHKLVFTEEAVVFMIENYTRESGVRGLNKIIASTIRSLAKKIVLETDYPETLCAEHIREILGVPKYMCERYQGNDYAGVATGLAWTAEGGDILFVEGSLSHGSGTLTLTGNMGSVMKESAIIALEYIKANCQQLQIPYGVFERWNVHVHVPDGAIPKDGPSAGLAMVVAMASAFTRRKIRSRIAMTGEITLRGKLMPVGGIKEKILAAKRACITDIYLPAANRRDIQEVNGLFLNGLNFIYINDISDALQQTLLEEKVNGGFKIE